MNTMSNRLRVILAPCAAAAMVRAASPVCRAAVVRCGMAAMALMVTLLLAAGPALAQPSGLPATNDPTMPSDVGITERNGNQVPLDLPFTDSSGATVTLRQLLRPGKPVILTPVYFECPSLCTVSLNATLEVLRQLSLTPGESFDVITFSFSHEEGPNLSAPKKQAYLKELGRPEAAAGWHFVTGSEQSIRTLTEAVGFGFKWSESQQQYAHASALIVLTPEGKVHRYLHGVHYDPSTLRLSLVEASQGKIGSFTDHLQLMFCFSFDPTKGIYTAQVMKIMRGGAALTVIALAVVIGWLLYRERHRKIADQQVHAHA
jgi:protein SCO1/2